MNRYTVTVVVSIEVPVIANSGDEACDMAEIAIEGRPDVFGKVVGVEAVCWTEG